MKETVTLSSQIKKHLADKGTLSEGELQTLVVETPPQESPKVEEKVVPEDADSRVIAGKESLDGLTQSGDEVPIDIAIGRDLIPKSTNPDDMFSLADDETETVTITAADKRRFQDCFVDGTRFTREFSICGGRFKGVFRNRKVIESRAILGELTRQAIAENHSAADYADNCRHALLHCQIAELNGVVKPEFEAPLRAVEKVNLDTRKVEVTPPKWALEMNVVYGDMGEGPQNILYRELKTFEKIYWALVRSAKDQDFWSPEDSTIE